MSNINDEVKYLGTHEWARLEGDTLTVGISDHAQELLGDIVFVELPEIGRNITSEEEAAIVESVKAASEIYSPMSGEVIEINERLEDEPEVINQSPYEEGWFYKLKVNNPEEFNNLLSPEDYKISCEE
tara:strand:+ start:54672 stop:55055 length:384 start_codon:yes stop_codon:yes gene_type:complete